MTESTSSGEQADTRLLQAVHKTFRLNLNRMVDASQMLEASALGHAIGNFWTFYAAVLHHHHDIEDSVAFPTLVAVRPDMGTLLDSLGEEHRKLLSSMDTVDRSVRALCSDASPENKAALHNALTALRGEFFPHLDVEDKEVVPAFGSSIPPKEWKKMDNDALKSIPRQQLPLAVGALDEVIKSLPAGEQPEGGPPLPIRLLLALAWRRKWATFVRPLIT